MKTALGTPDSGTEKIRRARLAWIASTFVARLAQPSQLVRRGTALRRKP